MERKVRVYEWNDTYISADGRTSMLLEKWCALRTAEGATTEELAVEIHALREQGRVLSMRYPCYGADVKTEDPFGVF